MVEILECLVSCPTCRSPLPTTHPSERGVRINRAATLGAEYASLRERRGRSKAAAHALIDLRVAEVTEELRELGYAVERGSVRPAGSPAPPVPGVEVGR